MSSSLLGILVAAAFILVGVDAYGSGVGSCAAGFDKFPVGTEHNWQNSTRPGGALQDNNGDVAASGMTVTLGETELQKPPGSDQFHYTGECDADYLCGKCQGSCTDDEGCEEGLQCFIRQADEDVPGCSGTVGLWDGTSYCYDPEEATRELQGQESQVDETFQVGEPYTLKLETPDNVPFKGYLFRLEGKDGQDLSGSIEMVSENMQILESTGEALGNGANIMATCAETVAAVSHTEPGEKTVAEALVTVPQPGQANLEVTIMVGEHEWYLTNYVLQFEGTAAPVAEEVSTPSKAPTDETPPTDSSPATEGETSGARQTVYSLFVTITLVGFGLSLC